MSASNHNSNPAPTAAPITNASTSSVRRNLFHAHLSRRPASSTSDNASAHHASSTTSLHAPKQHLSSSSSHSHYQPTSPASTATTTVEIIARDPQTNRPLLPTLPTLPPHLRISSSTSSTAAADNQPEGGGGDSGSSSGAAAYAAQLELEDALREKEDKERIEKSLVEMMYRSRNRAHGHATRAGASTTGGAGIGTDGEEVLALIQASLRKKAAGLEEDRWMYEREG